MQLSGTPWSDVRRGEAGAFRGWDVKYQSGYWQFDPGLLTSVVASSLEEGPADGSRTSSERPRALAEEARSVLFLASPGTISQPLIDALHRELPFLMIECVSEFSSAIKAFPRPIGLILAEWDILRKIDRALIHLAEGHPAAMLALLETNEPLERDAWSEAVGGYLVRGVLPMNIKLDVWLSIIHLMVRGGEYFPARVFEASGFPRQFASADNPAAPKRSIASLTPREKQILDLVSRGYQNKAIAAELELSESTVKVHIHNIISKLGSQNCTEAATLFRARSDGLVKRDSG